MPGVSLIGGMTLTSGVTLTSGGSAPPSGAMEIVWTVHPDRKTITLPFNNGGGAINLNVDWGDGSSIENVLLENPTHTYASAGDYTISVTGTMSPLPNGANFGLFDPFNQFQAGVKRINSWGTIPLTSAAYAFYRGATVEYVAQPTFTNWAAMFERAAEWGSFTADISGWNSSQVTNMTQMFKEAYNFNGNISSWNVGNVTNMDSMFESAYVFNQNISSWNVGNVTDMDDMFLSAQAFNQDLSGWNVSNVTTYNNFDAGATVWTLPKPNFPA
jgi:surface protein